MSARAHSPLAKNSASGGTLERHGRAAFIQHVFPRLTRPLTPRAGPDDTPAKHAAMFNRRATAGQCFHRPCLGTREFAADFALLPEGAALPESTLPAHQRDQDLGWMLHDFDHAAGATSRFFRARLDGGVLDVRAGLAAGVVQ